MENGQPVEGSLYFYAPNKIAPIVAAVLFGITGTWHLWQCIHYKAFKITALIPATCLVFVIGYAMREANAFDYTNLDIYITSMILIYLAPPVLELANYHILGRILYYVPYCSPIHPGRTLTTFGTLSAVVEILNGIGAAWSVNNKIDKDIAQVGNALLKASLIIQVMVIFIFVVFVASFQQRCHKMGISTRSVTGPCITMYITSFFIFVRCVFRTIEAFEGLRFAEAKTLDDVSPLVRYEWFFWAFEFVPMILTCFIWNFRHPRLYLPQNHLIYLAQDGHTELLGEGWDDDRAFWATMVDPFDCMGYGKTEKKPFWERNEIVNNHSM